MTTLKTGSVLSDRRSTAQKDTNKPFQTVTAYCSRRSDPHQLFMSKRHFIQLGSAHHQPPPHTHIKLIVPFSFLLYPIYYRILFSPTWHGCTIETNHKIAGAELPLGRVVLLNQRDHNNASYSIPIKCPTQVYKMEGKIQYSF